LLGIDPSIDVTDKDPLVWVRANIARRHLSVGQRALIAIEIAEMEQPAAAERRMANLTKKGETVERKNSYTRDSSIGRADELAGKQLGVSHTSVRIARNLSPEAKAEVSSGRMSLHAGSLLDKKRKQAAATSDDNAVEPQEPPAEEGPATVATRYESDFATVIGNAKGTAEAIVLRTENGKWRLHCSESRKVLLFKRRQDAVDRARTIIEELQNRGDD
jgi:hypothetical protein